MYTKFPNVQDAYKKLESLTTLDDKGLTSVGELAGEIGKGSAKSTVKNVIKAALDPTNYLSAKKFGETISTGAAKEAFSLSGGWFAFAKWFWSTKDLHATYVKTVVGTKNAAGVLVKTTPSVLILEIGWYLTFDVVKPIGEWYVKSQHDKKVKEQTATLDLVYLAYSNSANRIRSETKAAMDRVFEECKSISESFKSGLGKIILAGIAAFAKKDPEMADKWKKLWKPGLLAQLRMLRELSLLLYGLNVAAFVFSSQCQYGEMSNSALGFPEYTGYVHPERKALLNLNGQEVYDMLLVSVKRFEYLDKFIKAYWAMLAKKVGVTESDLE